jgi:hypothetical protein
MTEQVQEIDRPRLKKQLEVVREVMLGASYVGTWHTLGELNELTGYPEASISADLRHLRKAGNGGYVVEKRRRGAVGNGLWEYKVRVAQ